jgi:hypothetical protein
MADDIDPNAGDVQSFHTLVKDPNLQTWAQQRGWKDPDAVVQSFQNAEKLLGAPRDRLMVLPEGDDAAAWDPVYTRLGRPESADKYDIALKGPYDDGFLTAAKTAFHSNGLNGRQATGMAQWWESYIDGVVQAQDQATQQRFEEESAQLRHQWGEKYDEHNAAAEAAAKKLGLGEDDFKAIESALGPLKARTMMGVIASKVLDPSQDFGSKGQPTGWRMTPESAGAQIKALEMDSDFMGKYLRGDRSALQRMSELQQIASAGGEQAA